MISNSNIDRRWVSTILWSVTAYFWLCGLSAIFYPVSWLVIAGLPTTLTNELALAFAVAGTFMLTMGTAGIMAALNPHKQLGLIVTLMAGNLIDFLVTLRAVVLGQLPMLRGALFLAVAMTWAVLLGLVLFAAESRRRVV
jgi:hypothetical protein